MSRVYATEERLVHAPVDDVYRFLSDYRQHHANFLPPAFSDYRVERGGVSAGTEISYRLTLGGRPRQLRVRVDEPEPGRVLTETDLDSSIVTTFRLNPEGSDTRVRIETMWESSGPRGVVERAMAPRMLRRLFVDELARLDHYAQQQLARD